MACNRMLKEEQIKKERKKVEGRCSIMEFT
jgi:hypothetical protein